MSILKSSRFSRELFRIGRFNSVPFEKKKKIGSQFGPRMVGAAGPKHTSEQLKPNSLQKVIRSLCPCIFSNVDWVSEPVVNSVVPDTVTDPRCANPTRNLLLLLLQSQPTPVHPYPFSPTSSFRLSSPNTHQEKTRPLLSNSGPSPPNLRKPGEGKGSSFFSPSMAVSAGFAGPKLENLMPRDSPACSPSRSFAHVGSLKRMGRERRNGGGVRCEVTTAKEDPRLMELSGASALEQLKASALDSESPLRSRFLGSIDS